MANNNQEIESKFYLNNLPALEKRLKSLPAACIVPRGFEYNLRYDNPQGGLQRERKVLRLRKFDDVRLTFKGPGQQIGGALARTEIELVVNDFEQARQFLAALGYQTIMIYEKYRAIYQYEDALITLDELPYGSFTEIEAPNPGVISTLAQKLGLNLQAAIPNSYQGLFERVRQNRGLAIQQLTFADFTGLNITPQDLQVTPADQP